MAKKKARARRQAAPAISRRLAEGLAASRELLEEQHWAEARDLLEDLADRFPGRPEALEALLDAYHELNDMQGYEAAAERLVRLKPDDPDLALALADTYLLNMRPARALQAYRHFLARWPDSTEATKVRETVARLEEALPQMLAQIGLPEEEGYELALAHERAQSDLARGRYREGREGAEAILRRVPGFAPALNNLSLISWLEGRIEEASAGARRVLDSSPDNVHALSNLVHYLCAAGKLAEAQAYAGRLKASTAPAADRWTKKAEGLSFAGDDEGVMEVLRQAGRAGELKPPEGGAPLFHLAAVAALRLGHEAEARQYWQHALDLQPGFRLAADNLADLERPVAERDAPWPFTLASWITPQALEDLRRFAGSALQYRDEQSIGRAIRRYLRRHPEVLAVAPLLLDRGDAVGRQLALRLIREVRSPELLAALRDYALGQRGPDKARLEAARSASDAGLLPSEPVRMWLQGKWTEVLLLSFEIYTEPERRHAPQVQAWAEEAARATDEGDPQRAEQLLKQALSVEPSAPDLLNNLALAYEREGRAAEAEALAREIHERYPDYLFARLALARAHIRGGDTQRANELLAPLLRRKRLHATEFNALCATYIELYVAEGREAAARTWFELWESVNPRNPGLEPYRQLLGEPVRPQT